MRRVKKSHRKHSIFTDQQRHASSDSFSIKLVETSVEHGVIYPNIPCLYPLILTCIPLIMLPSLSMRAWMLAHGVPFSASCLGSFSSEFAWVSLAALKQRRFVRHPLVPLIAIVWMTENRLWFDQRALSCCSAATYNPQPLWCNVHCLIHRHPQFPLNPPVMVSLIFSALTTCGSGCSFKQPLWQLSLSQL